MHSITSSATPKLEIEHLSKYFVKRVGGRLEVLCDVSFRIARGEFVAVVGASGCGKTTLLRILDGLLEPTSGRLLLDGTEIHGITAQIAMVFQSDALFAWRTTLGNIVFGLEVQKRNKKEALSVANDLIRLVGLKGFEHHYPHELSGGMRQRVNLARALAVDPEVLLMDEPFAALDAQTREIMQLELLRIWSEREKTVLFVTHQIDEAVYLSDRVIIFSARPGRIKESIDIEIPRPRSLAVKRTPEFLQYVDQIWKLIEGDVMQAVGQLEVR